MASFHLPQSPGLDVTRHSRSRAEPDRDGAGSAGSFPRVLVAEDNELNQLMALRMLERRGYRADVVEDGRRALEALDHDEYAAVLMDCQMPELNGYDATSELRRRERGDVHTPVIAMTAHSLPGDREKCLASGMDDYLSKPLNPDNLDRALMRWAPKTTTGSDAPHQTPQAPPALDPAGLEQLLSEFAGTRTLTRLVAMFGTQTPDALAGMRSAIDAGDPQSVGESAHKLKGGCTSLAAIHMGGLCKELQARADGGSLDGATELVDEIDAAFEDAHAALLAQV